jgi:hypothetical protein
VLGAPAPPQFFGVGTDAERADGRQQHGDVAAAKRILFAPKAKVRSVGTDPDE